MHLNRRQALRIAVAGGSLVLLAACFQTGEIDTFADPSLAPGRINSIAFLPVLNANLLPPNAREINQAIGNAFVKRNPGLEQIVRAEKAEKILQSSGVMSDWARLIDVSGSRRVPDENALRIINEPPFGRLINIPKSDHLPDGDALRVIGAVLNVDAIMQGELVGVVQRDGCVLCVKSDLFDVLASLYGYGTANSQSGATGVIIRYALFATSDARLLWSASAEGLAFNASSLEPAPDVMVAINIALTEIYEKIPLL